MCIDLEDLIKGLLVVTPEERMSFPEVLCHPWMEEETSFLEDNEEYNFYIVKNETGGKLKFNPDHDPTATPSLCEVKIENIFFDEKMSAKLSFKDYCYIANDFYTHHIGIYFVCVIYIDEDALRIVETFGYPRSVVLASLHRGEMNHATTCYNLLTLS